MGSSTAVINAVGDYSGYSFLSYCDVELEHETHIPFGDMNKTIPTYFIAQYLSQLREVFM